MLCLHSLSHSLQLCAETTDHHSTRTWEASQTQPCLLLPWTCSMGVTNVTGWRMTPDTKVFFCQFKSVKPYQNESHTNVCQKTWGFLQCVSFMLKDFHYTGSQKLFLVPFRKLCLFVAFGIRQNNYFQYVKYQKKHWLHLDMHFLNRKHISPQGY